MCAAALSLADDADCFIGAAAVADYRPEIIADEKIKKRGGAIELRLIENPDIISRVAQLPGRPKLMAGFAAETHDVLHHAREKRIRKGLDMIIANDVSAPETTFGSDQNAVFLITDSEETPLPLASKRVIAEQIVAALAAQLSA